MCRDISANALNFKIENSQRILIEEKRKPHKDDMIERFFRRKVAVALHCNV